MAGAFQASVLTQKGIALLAKAQVGRCTVALTKAASGDGDYDAAEDLTAKTALKSQKQTFPLTNVTILNQSNVYVKFVMSNHMDADHGGDLVDGYYVKELGLFATDPDEGEILYAIALGVVNQWDYMPAYNSLLPATITVDFLAEVSNADTVTIEAPNQMFLYDATTGDKYVLGVENGLLYYEEVEE